jgi:tRNA(fMet)-specific endonuclease VapC
LGEYLFGIKQSRDRSRYEDFIRTTIPISNIVDLSFETANNYSEIRLELKRAGTPIPANDIWIAAIARQLNEPILTNDHHFDYVENIETVNF